MYDFEHLQNLNSNSNPSQYTRIQFVWNTSDVTFLYSIEYVFPDSSGDKLNFDKKLNPHE